MSKRWIVIWVLWAIAVLFIFALYPAFAQYDYPGPPMWDRGPNREYRQERRLPERTYNPYDRGPERWRPSPPRGIGPEEYDRRSFCAMHLRECP